MTRFAVILALAGMFWCPADPAGAQDVLTLDSAVLQALTRNSRLQAARAGTALAVAEADAARAGWLPRITLNESWQRGNQPVFVFSSLLASRVFAPADFAIDTLNHPGPTGFFHRSLSVEQLLFDGGRQRALIRDAEIRKERSALSVTESASALASAVTQTYGRILVAEAGARAARDALTFAEEDRARAARRRDAGMASEADVLALAAQAAALRQRQIDDDAEAAIGRAELNRLMAAPIDRQFAVAELPPADSFPALSLTAALAQADANRPELQRARLAVTLADAGRAGARAALLPQVTAQAAFESSGRGISAREPSWIVGGALHWSLSLGGAELAGARAASQNTVRAAAEADDVRASVHVEVATAYRHLEAARARQAVANAAIAQARERQRIIRDRFDAGMAAVSDVLQASSAVTEAEAQRIAAAVDTINGETQLRHAVGGQP